MKIERCAKRLNRRAWQCAWLCAWQCVAKTIGRQRAADVPDAVLNSMENGGRTNQRDPNKRAGSEERQAFHKSGRWTIVRGMQGETTSGWRATNKESGRCWVVAFATGRTKALSVTRRICVGRAGDTHKKCSADTDMLDLGATGRRRENNNLEQWPNDGLAMDFGDDRQQQQRRARVTMRRTWGLAVC